MLTATLGVMNAATARVFRLIMPVTNIDDSARYYGALLESPGIRVSPGRHYFDCGGVIVALYNSLSDGDRLPVRHHAESIYLAVSDLAAAFARAQKVGGLSTETGDGGLAMGEIARRPWGELSFYMHDPSGNPLCFVDETSIFRGSR